MKFLKVLNQPLDLRFALDLNLISKDFQFVFYPLIDTWSFVKTVVGSIFPVESVKHRPILTRPPRNTTVLVGNNVTMTCEVLSAAHRHLEWYHGYHTSFDTVNKTNQSFRVEVKVGMQNYLKLHETHPETTCFCFFYR